MGIQYHTLSMQEQPDESDRIAAHFWERISQEISGLATEYDDRGWQAFDVQVGSVTAVHDTEQKERNGFSVLIPDNQFEELAKNKRFLEEFSSYELYKTNQTNLVYLVAAVEHSQARVAFLVPMYYNPSEQSLRKMFETAEKTGVIHVTLRTLSGDNITLTFDDPELFKPRS